MSKCIPNKCADYFTIYSDGDYDFDLVSDKLIDYLRDTLDEDDFFIYNNWDITNKVKVYNETYHILNWKYVEDFRILFVRILFEELTNF